jgi:putative peptidoglycan lipid II flippase
VGLKRVFRNSLLVMLGTLASRLAGVVRQIVFNNLYPSDLLKDAFNVAYRVPNLFRELLAEGGVQNALIPVLKSLPPAEGRVFGRRFAALLLGLNLAVIGLGWWAAPWLAHLLIDPGSTTLRQPENFDLVVLLMRLALPFLLGISLSALFTALLQSEERFGASAFSPLAFNAGSILLMLLFPGDPAALGLSVTLGGLLQAAVQLPFLRGFALEWRSHPAFALALRRMVPFLFTTSSRQLLNLVLVSLLTAYPAATVTGFYNAELIFLTAIGVLAVSPAMAVFPRLSQLHAQGEKAALEGLFRQVASRMLVLLGLASALLGALAPWLVSLFDWSPNFSDANRQATTVFLASFALALLPHGLNALLVRGFYATGQVAAAVRITVVTVLLNALAYYLLRGQEVVWLNVATAGAGLLASLGYWRQLVRLGLIRPGWLPSLLGRVLLAALPSGAAAFATAYSFGTGQPFWLALIPLMMGGIAGLLMFGLMARVLRLPLRLGV